MPIVASSPEHMRAMTEASRQRGWHNRNHPPDPRLDEAACRNHPDLDPDAWFEDHVSHLRDAAIATCHACPCRTLCATWAVADLSLTGGIFAGLSDEERREERARRKESAERAAASPEAEARRQRGRELHRDAARRAQRLRRKLGKDETPEQMRARYKIYYAEHRDEINARRRAAYAAAARARFGAA
jgi:hypothetical protein